MKKILLLIICAFAFLGTQAQKLSAYKYVVVPKQFKMQKEAGQYNLNNLVASTFKKFDFETMLEGDLPPEGFDPCKALKVAVNKRGFLTTYISFDLIDCYGRTVHTTLEGASREKDFQKSYYEAFRKVFEDPYIESHEYIASAAETKVQAKEGGLSKAAIIAEAKKRLEAIEAAESARLGEESRIKNITNVNYAFEFLGKRYDFRKSLSGFDIFSEGGKLGAASKLANGQFKINAGALSGKGFFDAFGNFVLKRINPLNQKEITDTLARIQ